MKIAHSLNLAFVLIIIILFACATDRDEENDTIVQTFYYPWYGNIETDSEYRHWNHQVLGEIETQFNYPGDDNIGANFYPQLGCYRSNDDTVIQQHMIQMKNAGIDAACVSWWGKDSFEDNTIPLILEIADQYDIKICFHIEPFEDRNAHTTKDAIVYLIDQYGDHPAFFRDKRFDNRPLFYIYDSYLTSADDWASILDRSGSNTIRDTKYDALVIALWIDAIDSSFIIDGHFDGFYTYFAVDRFTYASSLINWPDLSEWAERHNKIFIPCVGPGYIDTRIRPWNSVNTRSRDDGRYYDRMFANAIDQNPSYIGITSFNEWHEGTQIEPAVPMSIEDYKYQDYSPQQPDYYLKRTNHWIDILDDKSGKYDSIIHSLIATDDMIIQHKGYMKKVKLSSHPDSKYNPGEFGLVDGVRGSDNYRDGSWTGIEGDNLILEIDLGEITTVSKITVGFLQNTDAWIFLPEHVNISVSTDGNNFSNYDLIKNHIPTDSTGTFIFDFTKYYSHTELRYIKIIGRNIGVCPEWHPAQGGKAWIFTDEVIIE